MITFTFGSIAIIFLIYAYLTRLFYYSHEDIMNGKKQNALALSYKEVISEYSLKEVEQLRKEFITSSNCAIVYGAFFTIMALYNLRPQGIYYSDFFYGLSLAICFSGYFKIKLSIDTGVKQVIFGAVLCILFLLYFSFMGY